MKNKTDNYLCKSNIIKVDNIVVEMNYIDKSKEFNECILNIIKNRYIGE